MNENLHWISYHGSFDYGYFYRLIKSSLLPDYQEDFQAEIKQYFPHNYDLKYIIGKKYDKEHDSFNDVQGGLQRISENLGITRLGIAHQAGSDAWLTGMIFFRLKAMHFKMNDQEFDREYNNMIFGIGESKNEEYYIQDYKKRANY